MGDFITNGFRVEGFWSGGLEGRLVLGISGVTVWVIRAFHLLTTYH